LTPTGIRGPISSPRSLLPRRRGKESLHGGAGRWLHPPVEAGACATVRQYIPAILVSSNKGWQRRWFYLRNDDGRLPSFSQRVVTAVGSNLALWGPTRETEESPAPSRGLAGAARRRAHRHGGGCRHPSPEGAPLDGAAAAAFGDGAGGRLGGFTDVLGPPPHR
jgi:hypothetical protein